MTDRRRFLTTASEAMAAVAAATLADAPKLGLHNAARYHVAEGAYHQFVAS